MKLKDLNPQLGESYGSPTKGTAVITIGGCMRVSRDGMCFGHNGVANVDGDDWQLLQPVPVLGEEIKSNSFAPGQRLLTVINGKIFPAWLHTGDGVLNFLDNHGYFHRCTTPVYLDPRPIPALPPEPSLDEQLEQIARGNPAQWPRQIIAQVKQIPQIAALIGGSDE